MHTTTSTVKKIFSTVANKYDIMNDVMSFFIHRIWKATAIEKAHIEPNFKILDLASGSADLALRMADKISTFGELIVSDINIDMLKLGKDKLINNNKINNINYCVANAECLPFTENYFDLITIAFGLRNIMAKELSLSEMLRVLKPNGRLVILEFSHIDANTYPISKMLYKIYAKIIPCLGALIADSKASYQYLVDSINAHPKQEELKAMLEQSGFQNCSFHNLTYGVVAIHTGFKACNSITV